MKIAHLIATNFFGGPEKQIIEHAKRMWQGSPEKRRFFEIIIISFIERAMPNELIDTAKAAAIPAKVLHTRSPFHPRVVFELAALLRKEEISILCAHGYKSNVIGRMASWLAGIPHVAISRGWTGEDLKIRVYEYFDKIFLKFANRIVAVSDGQRRKVLGLGIAPEKVSVIHNSIDFDNEAVIEGYPLAPQKISDFSGTPLRSELGIGPDCRLVVSAGRLSSEKNFAALIQAAQLVKERNAAVRFVVFGEGVLRRKLEEQIRASGLEGFFSLPGFRKNFAILLKEADIFVLPSFTEGLPNVVLEAYAAKKPVIATAVGGTPEVVRHGVTGFLVAPSAIEQMARYILLLLGDEGTGKAMGYRGYIYMKERFSFDNQTRDFENLYGEVYDSFHHRRYAC